MKINWLLLLVCLACCSCHRPEKPIKPENHDIGVWLMPKTNGVRIAIGHCEVEASVFNAILKKATHDDNDVGLIVCLPLGVGVSNSLFVMNLAEKYGITNIVVRLNQTHPPRISRVIPPYGSP